MTNNGTLGVERCLFLWHQPEQRSTKRTSAPHWERSWRSNWAPDCEQPGQSRDRHHRNVYKSDIGFRFHDLDQPRRNGLFPS
jgi:hypothetical protein